MKKITVYSLFLLFLTFSISCVKEADIITESDPEVIPQEGETRILTGIIRDTSGSTLPQARIKIILADLELETETDENGEWNLTVPNSLTEAYIVANKVEYSKSIQRFNQTENNLVKDIYLAKTPSNTELDLKLNLNNLVTVSGRIIDQNDNPVSDVLLFILSTLDGSPDVFNGFKPNNADGTFEIIYEDNGFSSSTLYGLFSGGCSDHISIVLQNQVPVQDLGDVELPYDDYSVFQTRLESDGSSCYDNVSTLAFVYDLEAAFTENSYNQPLGDVSLDYCLNEDAAVYIGVESDDNTHFNGLFVSPSQVEASYMLDICPPNPGNFLELSINGSVVVYEDNLSFASPSTIFSHDPNTPLSITFMNWVISWTATVGDHPKYQIGKIKSLEIEGANNISYMLEDGSPVNYLNVVQDDNDFYAGIAKAKLKGNDNSGAEMTIRFRVSK